MSDVRDQADGIHAPGWAHVYSGKVRDLFVPEGEVLENASALLVVASDRVSAFDHVLSPEIPRKGALLTTLSRWWFERLDVANHLFDGVAAPPVPAALEERAMVVAPLRMFPIECVVRGYLTGSGFTEYQASQTVCGVALPAGLNDGDRLPTPIYTPAWKAPLGEHDENISFERSVELVGPDIATRLRALSIGIYAQASAVAAERGLILADTKFEFGAHPVTGEITLGDEVLTSDSSRYWDAAAWERGASPAERMASFDKQPVRDWLAANWNGQGAPPPLAPEVVAATTERYERLVALLTA